MKETNGRTQTECIHRVLRRIYVPNRKEVTRCWRRMYNEELNDFVPLTG
jgi:hypothetical protein